MDVGKLEVAILVTRTLVRGSRLVDDYCRVEEVLEVRRGLAIQGCESKDVAWFHKMVANVGQELEGQKRERSHSSVFGGVEWIK